MLALNEHRTVSFEGA